MNHRSPRIWFQVLRLIEVNVLIKIMIYNKSQLRKNSAL